MIKANILGVQNFRIVTIEVILNNYFILQIHLHQDNFKLANQSLEVGLSHNFEVSFKLSKNTSLVRAMDLITGCKVG